MTCPCVPVCHKRHWPRWAVIGLFLAGLALNLAIGGATWTAARYYERSLMWQRDAKLMERIADGMSERDVKRQLAQEKVKKAK